MSIERLTQRPSQVEGPQMVTHGGSEAGRLVPLDEGQRLEPAARPTLKQLLLSNQARTELAIPTRCQARRRPSVPTRSTVTR